jgi:nitrate reductase beta subunit
MPFWKKSIPDLKPLDYFSTIDELPIKVWFDVHSTGDYGLLLKGDRKISVEQYQKLFEVWESIYNQHIERFGLSEEFLEDLNLQIEIANYRAKYIITGQRHLRTMVRIKEEELMAGNSDTKKPLELEELLAKMSKYYGFKLESKELTHVQYYSYLKTVKNG